MMENILYLFSIVFLNLSHWFSDILLATDAYGVVLGMLTLYLIVRFLISPLTGSGSDKVTKRKKVSDG